MHEVTARLRPGHTERVCVRVASALRPRDGVAPHHLCSTVVQCFSWIHARKNCCGLFYLIWNFVNSKEPNKGLFHFHKILFLQEFSRKATPEISCKVLPKILSLARLCSINTRCHKNFKRILHVLCKSNGLFLGVSFSRIKREAPIMDILERLGTRWADATEGPVWILRKNKDHICRQIRISFTGSEVLTKCYQLYSFVDVVCCPFVCWKRSSRSATYEEGEFVKADMYMFCEKTQRHTKRERERKGKKQCRDTVGVTSSPIRKKNIIIKVIGKFAPYSLRIGTFSMFSFFSFSKITTSQLHLPQITKPWFDYVFLITWNTCGS